MDIACWLRATAIFLAVAVGANPWYRIPQLYLLAVFPLFLHYLRSLTAHNYLSDGSPQGFLDQVLDSIDITGDRVFTELLYPIGLRYHALHHLFPAMPYHNLAVAHKRLMAHLPADSPYRQVVYPNFLSVIRELVRHSKAAGDRENESHNASPTLNPT
jgi:fatty acid desaturase